ncbi:phosphoenolpyruvate synthase [Lipingzhangella sp. LS1_29]|uniref:Phosphoenolpyruvate synthase n=1 Tax=Lipingzhangella rawalii TaxID=2055835 RepID=A0ABU2HC00_9ACTN|nr:phosphoenolpyruvate synthase [Lipingzhangella rawalii]MDS1272364.1 phosphoenolpyruvate synthase [Lipingzhangella rawalii]
MPSIRYVRDLDDVGIGDVKSVGGKNASSGELLRELAAAGVSVPGGFATTADAYWEFLDANELRGFIADQVARLGQGEPVSSVGDAVRSAMLAAQLPDDLREAIHAAYRQLGQQVGRRDLDVAVRSSATAEDLPNASFAGQQDSFLNISGEAALLAACKRCYASLFTDRAINYREDQGFDHLDIALSVGVQRMVRSDLAGSGVLFTIDPENGFPHHVVISAAYGLGESVVQGLVDPDEYTVFKHLLRENTQARPITSKARGRKEFRIVYGSGEERLQTEVTSSSERTSYVLHDEEICTLARWGVLIEDHYGTAMDVEWAKDGRTGELFVVQARPETVQAHQGPGSLHTFHLTESGQRLVSGIAVGGAIAVGRTCVLRDPTEIDRFESGAVLVTTNTDPDWEPIMKRAAAIVTDHGGRTSHAAIVSRELGVPALVGVGNATRRLAPEAEVTVCCAEGETGHVYAGRLAYEKREFDPRTVPETRTKISLNIGNPDAALRWWRLPADGVGLARMEFIVANHIRAHPMALLHPERLTAGDRTRIARLIEGSPSGADYFVERLAHGVARIAASRWPQPVILRMSDFKTNEYARLIGGGPFEPAEENPMLGWRGASRYYTEGYREGFSLECRAVRRVRDDIGLTNLVLMVPFCRTLREADRVIDVMAEEGLRRGENGLRVFVMGEIPANVVLAAEFAERFDGFSIGSNDLTQLLLGVDRDSAELAELFDERDPAVIASIEQLVAAAHANERPVGMCGQRPSDDPDFARILVSMGIDSISVTPDSFLAVKEHVLAAELESG